MCSPVSGATEGNLYDPSFGRSLGGIVEQGFLIEAEEDFLDHVLGLAAIVQNAKGDCKHQPCMPAEELVQGLCVLGLEASHEFFVAGGANLDRLGRCN